MAFRGDIEALVLAILSDGPKHGYEISKRIKALSKNTLAYGEGQLYPALHKLEETGDIRSEWEASQEQRPPRKVYSVTDSGTAKLAKKKLEWAKFQESVTSILGAMPAVEGTRG
jgi:PadR family transcriptional regulator PadR